jgi:hypothetical protein
LNLPAEIRMLIWDAIGWHTIVLYRSGPRLAHVLVEGGNSIVRTDDVPIQLETFQEAVSRLPIALQRPAQGSTQSFGNQIAVLV